MPSSGLPADGRNPPKTTWIQADVSRDDLEAYFRGPTPSDIWHGFSNSRTMLPRTPVQVNAYLVTLALFGSAALPHGVRAAADREALTASV
ncbi:hypothetical protein ACVWWN_005052 [Mycobacterium sp. URHB0021]|jgi:hypothetical protein